ncbi:acyclic terpene utilization AtuA family protein [Paraburkholderia flagellata]|uniref:acyclic terpene utilization AtuA family protein n=1 Tax=Paraburkholderia flagellata TaxID=2883241 RepID=UPI001F446227|nr:acyclic terpene utilization AtuA family protein [Paraburkholderia flagellata]
MDKPIRVLTPTCTLGYGFANDAFERAMSMQPDVIAVDAGSTDPGPHYLGSGEALVSEISIRRELTQLILAARKAGIPVIVGSAGGAGTRIHVDDVVRIVREIVAEHALSLRLAWIYADIAASVVADAVGCGEVRDFEAGWELSADEARASHAIVAQMGHEPIVEALEAGADVIIAGRACDDSVIAAFPIWKGADPGLAIHMGKILECGAFSAEPHGTDVMMGTIDNTGFTLEPGSMKRRASLTSVAAHTLYERENPFRQAGPGHELDLSACEFTQISEREVRVNGSRFIATDDYWIKLEGARRRGYRTITVAGVRCPTMVARIDTLLADAKAAALAYFAAPDLDVQFHVYGRDGVMRGLEPVKKTATHELGLVIEAVAHEQSLAHAAAHFLSGTLLHVSFPGMYNTAGNLAFPYSPSEVDAGPVYEFSTYHLLKTVSPTALFPIHHEALAS